MPSIASALPLAMMQPISSTTAVQPGGRTMVVSRSSMIAGPLNALARGRGWCDRRPARPRPSLQACTLSRALRLAGRRRQAHRPVERDVGPVRGEPPADDLDRHVRRIDAVGLDRRPRTRRGSPRRRGASRGSTSKRRSPRSAGRSSAGRRRRSRPTVSSAAAGLGQRGGGLVGHLAQDAIDLVPVERRQTRRERCAPDRAAPASPACRRPRARWPAAGRSPSELCSSSPTAQACTGPAPPKASSGRPR